MMVVVSAVPAIPPRRGLTNVEQPFEIHPSESETRVVGLVGGTGREVPAEEEEVNFH